MRKVKKDSDKTIIRCQRIEIDGLMASERVYKQENETLVKEVQYYKDKYNQMAEERNGWKRRDWERGIVIDVLTNHIGSLENALNAPREFKMQVPVQERKISNEEG